MSNKTTGAVIIMRGIPGSGKSTFVRQKYSHATVCSADHYFTDDEGNYEFDIDEIGEAHQYCRNQFYEAIDCKDPLIVVDNTNLTMRAMEFYIAEAIEHNYEIIFVHVVTPINIALERQTHNVPEETVQEFADKMEELPSDFKDREVKMLTESYGGTCPNCGYASSGGPAMSSTGSRKNRLRPKNNEKTEQAIKSVK